MSSLVGGMEKEKLVERDKKKLGRQNSFFRVNSERARPESKDFTKSCLECCYSNRCCLPVYYLLSCIFKSDEQASVTCCCSQDN